MPLIAVQILWLNLITDGFLTFALATEGENEELMKFSPNRYKKDILDRLMIFRTVFLGGIMAIGSIIFFQLQLAHHSLEYARTGLLLLMAMYQWINAFNMKSETESIFKVGIFSNLNILIAIFLQIILAAMAIYVPIFQTVLKTVPIQPEVWVYAILFSLPLVIFEEIRKSYINHIINEYSVPLFKTHKI